MSWMAPYPTADTRWAPHWVAADAERNERGDLYRSECGRWVTSQRGRDADYGPERPESDDVCQKAARYPYPGVGEAM